MSGWAWEGGSLSKQHMCDLLNHGKVMGEVKQLRHHQLMDSGGVEGRGAVEKGEWIEMDE